MSSIVIELKGKDGATPVIGKASDDIVKKVEKLSSRTQGSVQKMALKFTSGLGGAIGKVGRALTSLKTLAIGALAGWGLNKIMSQFEKLTGTQQQAEAGLMAAMKFMGRYTDEYYAGITSVASALQKQTTFGDEAILQGAKFLQTYKDISDDVMPRVMAAMTDLAALQGGDMKSAANMLGKASMGMTGELRRVGITVDETTYKSKGFIGVLEQIESQVKGQAAAIRNTDTGGLIGFKNLLGDIGEKLGSVTLKVKSMIVDKMIPYIEQLNDKLGEWVKSSEAEKWIIGFGNTAVQVIAKVVETIGWMPTALYSVKEAIHKVMSFLSAMGSKAVEIISIGSLNIGDAAKMGVNMLKGMSFKDALSSVSPEFAKVRSWFDEAGVGQYDAAREAAESAQKFADWGVKMEGVAAKIRAIKFETKDLKKEVATLPASSGSILGGAGTEAAEKMTQTVKQAAANTITELKKIAMEDKGTLEGRLAEYTKFYSQLEQMIKKNSDQEKAHIKELEELYAKKADAQRTAEEMIRGLREIGVSAAEAYESKRSGLSEQYMAAMRLSGQEQIDALEKYKSAVASLAKEHGQGIKETVAGISGETERLAVSGEQIIKAAITDIQNATAIQTQAFRAIEAEKERQIEQDRIWGSTLKTTANEVAGEINYLQNQIGALSAEIARMDKIIELEGEDYVSPVIDQIQSNLEALHRYAQKPVIITTIHRDIYAGSESGPDIQGSYQTGTDYVPRTGIYRLHEGEAVLDPADAETARKSGVLRGSAGAMEDMFETGGNGSIAKIIEFESMNRVSPVISQIQSNLEALHIYAQKPVIITTIHRDVYAGESGPDIQGSYQTGTDYVPRTGIYRLHEGEAVLDPADAETARKSGVLRGSAGAMEDMFETGGNGSIAKIIEFESMNRVSPVISQIQSNLEALHIYAQKPVIITTIHRDVYAGESAPDIQGSYQTGTNYVPRTGIYRLHEGDAVLDREDAETTRKSGVLRGSAGAMEDMFETGRSGSMINERNYSSFVKSSSFNSYTSRRSEIVSDRGSRRQRSVASNVEFKGDINIILPANTQTKTQQDWRMIVREQIIPELKKADYRVRS